MPHGAVLSSPQGYGNWTCDLPQSSGPLWTWHSGTRGWARALLTVPLFMELLGHCITVTILPDWPCRPSPMQYPAHEEPCSPDLVQGQFDNPGIKKYLNGVGVLCQDTLPIWIHTLGYTKKISHIFKTYDGVANQRVIKVLQAACVCDTWEIREGSGSTQQQIWQKAEQEMRQKAQNREQNAKQ